MVKKSILFSVLTPTWNRAPYLRRVYEGLAAQSYRSFEWIIADDGSTDETDRTIREIAAGANFPIILIQANKHVGKIRMDNAAVRQARGHFILWCDSDDWLLPKTLERLNETWQEIPANRRSEFVGMTALASTNDGVIAAPKLDGTNIDVSWNDLAESFRITGDMLFCACASELKENPFPEVDLVIPESVVWTKIGNKLTRLIPETLLVKEYQAAHGISFSGTMSYNRGRAFALAATVNNLRAYNQPFKTRVWRLITFIRYAYHGEVNLLKAKKLWRNNSISLFFWMAVPFAWLLVIKDILQKKVIRTHREFEDNNNYQISVEQLLPQILND